jgi:dTDP-4-amino-4,6-dideoxygalactose transaminase
VKLGHLAQWNARRRDRAAEYDRLLAGNEAITCPYEPSWSRAVYHLYVVRSADRDGLAKHLKAAGIGTGIHYPVPLHLQKAYKGMNYRETDFPVATRLAGEILSLPMFPQLSSEQQTRVTDGILGFVQDVLISQ